MFCFLVLLSVVILQSNKKEESWSKLIIKCLNSMFSELEMGEGQAGRGPGRVGLAYTRVLNEERQKLW